MRQNHKIKRKWQRGDVPIGQILLIGAVLIPLILLLIRYKADVYMFFIDKNVEVMTNTP